MLAKKELTLENQKLIKEVILLQFNLSVVSALNNYIVCEYFLKHNQQFGLQHLNL